jgi:hypothetical protein
VVFAGVSVQPPTKDNITDSKNLAAADWVGNSIDRLFAQASGLFCEH